MALRVLTDEERESLRTHPDYQSKCEWAARNYADYWSIHDGAGLATEAARIKWAKDRFLGVDIKLRDVNDPNIALRCLRASKAMEVDLNAAPVTPEEIVTAMLAQNKFAEIAGLYFDLKGEDLNFVVGGN